MNSLCTNFKGFVKHFLGIQDTTDQLNTTSQLTQLPVPIQSHILSFLDDDALKKLSTTSKYWHSMASTYALSTIISQDRFKSLPEISLPPTVKADGTDGKKHFLLKKSGDDYSKTSVGEYLEEKDLEGKNLCKGKDPIGRIFITARYSLTTGETGLITIEQERPNNGFLWKVTYSGPAKLHLLTNWKTNELIRDYMKKLLLHNSCGLPTFENYQFTENPSRGTIIITR